MSTFFKMYKCQLQNRNNEILDEDIVHAIRND